MWDNNNNNIVVSISYNVVLFVTIEIGREQKKDHMDAFFRRVCVSYTHVGTFHTRSRQA